MRWYTEFKAAANIRILKAHLLLPSRYPFDTQSCEMVIPKVSHYGSKIDYKLGNSCLWKILKRFWSAREILENLWSLCLSNSTISDPRISLNTSSGQKTFQRMNVASISYSLFQEVFVEVWWCSWIIFLLWPFTFFLCIYPSFNDWVWAPEKLLKHACSMFVCCTQQDIKDASM